MSNASRATRSLSMLVLLATTGPTGLLACDITFPSTPSDEAGGGSTNDGGVSPSTDGGSSSEAGPDAGAPGDSTSAGPPVVPLSPCSPGKGKDYPVGPGAGQIASLDQVPWESLGPGDTVRIHHRPAPYAGKFVIVGKGTADAPIRVCGVRGANGERPIIDGQDATTRAALKNLYGGKAYDQDIHQGRTVILLKNDPSSWTAFPEHIQIDGLAIRRGHPNYRFKDAAGATKTYAEFGACLWVERGQHITIADNEITDCQQAIFSKSSDDGDFALTKDLRIAGNIFSNNGISGSYTLHTTYVQSVGVLYELNRYGTLRSGAAGNSLKDRSVGAVIRYNRIEDGARAIDLVEAEDYPNAAKADPAYRTTFVYGNQIEKDGEKGSTIHYGGDHQGSEGNYRKGTLYFFHNTVHLKGNGYGVLFQLSTTEEKAEVFNNVFVFDASIPYPSMRAGQENAAGYTAGGIVNLGKNWIDARWADSDPYHPIPGQLNGASNMITGTDAPVDLVTFAPKAGTSILDAAQSSVGAASGHPVNMQLDGTRTPKPRVVVGPASDLGAVER